MTDIFDNCDVDVSLIPDTNSHVGCANDPSTAERDVYSREFKIHCASVWLLKGTNQGASIETQVPLTTFYQWVNSDWWATAVAAARKLYSQEMVAGFSRIQMKAQEVILDRLENGNEVMTKEGVQRVAMTGKDAAIVAAIAFDKRQIAMGNPTAIRKNQGQSREDMAARLRKKAQERAEPLKVVGGTET
jgi:hypothetical protein